MNVTEDRHRRVHLNERERLAMWAVHRLGGCEVRRDAWGPFVHVTDFDEFARNVHRVDWALTWPASDVLNRVRGAGR